jgi:hypothetical protein
MTPKSSALRHDAPLEAAASEREAVALRSFFRLAEVWGLSMEQARVLLGHIRERPIFGYGFGTIAEDYSYRRTYTYELAYLDLLYKTGVVGTALFLSYPLRLLADGVRGRVGRLRLPTGVPQAEVSIPASIIVSILITGATNPYFLGAYGLMPILATIAWLDPLGGAETRDNT